MANTDNMSVKVKDSGSVEVQVAGNVGDLESKMKGDLVGKHGTPGAVQVQDGQITRHGPQKVSTYRDHTGVDVMQTVQKVHGGSPGTPADALADPSAYTVTIQGQTLTLEAAIKGGLVSTTQDTISEVKTPEAPNASKQTPPDFKPVASERFAGFIEKGRSLDPGFDQLLARCLLHAGEGTPSKQALVELGDVMGENPETARNFINAVSSDIAETTHNRLSVQYGSEGADAWAWVIDNCSGQIKGTYLARLANGDPTAIDEIYQRGSNKTKY